MHRPKLTHRLKSAFYREATSFLPIFHPDPRIASFTLHTTVMSDIASVFPEHAPTGPPLPFTEDPSPNDTLIHRTTSFVRDHMSSPRFDESHDFAHIERVVALSQHIFRAEQQSNTFTIYDPTIIILSALLHDIADHKYPLPRTSKLVDPLTLAKETLLSLGAAEPLARAVQGIVNAVSYSHEIRNQARVLGVLLQHPELGIVQDADRLDALGAVGIARAFTFGAGKEQKGKMGLHGTVDHFGDKLERLEGMMKTEEGRRLAKIRTERLKVFKEWWDEETGIVDSV